MWRRAVWLIVTCIALASAHKGCIHDQIVQREVVRGKQAYEPLQSDRRQADAQYQPIRITFDYTCNVCLEKNGQPQAQHEYVKLNMEKAKTWLQSALKVKRVVGNLKTSQEKMNKVVTVPETYRTTGVPNTDLLIFVRSSENDPDGCSEGTIAYARHTEQDTTLDRPTFGIIDMCIAHNKPDQTSDARTKTMYDREEDFHTTLHEIVHILGHSASLYPFFRDQNGQPRNPVHCTQAEVNAFMNNQCSKVIGGYCFACIKVNDAPLNVTIVGKDANGKPIADLTRYMSDIYYVSAAAPSTLEKVQNRHTYLKTPKLLEVARTHFGCPSWPGVALEDDGGGGTALSHWDKRMLMNEFLCGAPSKFVNSKSAFTLAVLEDSGWYKADFSKADPLAWGYKHGCDFFNKCMNDADKTISPGSFCTTEAAPGSGIAGFECTHDRSGYAPCVGNAWNQYMDGCKFVNPAYGFLCSNWLENAATGNKHSGNQPFHYQQRGAVLSSTSKCFTSNLWRQFDTSPAKGNAPQVGCYEARCTAQGSIWKLEIRDPLSTWQVCTPNKKLTVAGYEGAISCPPEWNNFCGWTTQAVTPGNSTNPTIPPAPVAEKICSVNEYFYDSGCRGSKLIARSCVDNVQTGNLCMEHLGQTADSTISRAFCLRSISKHCEALKTTTESGMGSCETWCKASELVACSNTADCKTSAVPTFQVTNPSFPNLVCPTIMDPERLTKLEGRLCCHYLQKIIKNNCKPIPCESLKTYVSTLQASGGCSVAKVAFLTFRMRAIFQDCVNDGSIDDISVLFTTFNRLKTSFRTCLSASSYKKGTPGISDCTRLNLTIAEGMCRGYNLGWSACTVDETCGKQVVKDIEQTFTTELGENILRRACFAGGGSPRCQASTLFMCEMLVTSVWPAQCGDKLDCINPSFLPNAMEPVPPLCCDSLRQSIVSNCEGLVPASLDSYIAAVKEKGIPIVEVSQGSGSQATQKYQPSCDSPNCITASICSHVKFPDKYLRTEAYCSMLHDKYFLNQGLATDPVGWDQAIKRAFQAMPVDVYRKDDLVCQKMHKQWMCSMHARPCTLTGKEATALCMDFCKGFMKCNTSITDQIATMRTNEVSAQNMSDEELVDLSAFRTCSAIGVSSNFNTEKKCFNGVELKDEFSSGAGWLSAFSSVTGIFTLWSIVFVIVQPPDFKM